MKSNNTSHNNKSNAVANNAGAKGISISPVAQLEKFIKDKTHIIHLHIDIGGGDHLQIGGDRYDLLVGNDYGYARLTKALEALLELEGGKDVKGFEACKKWLEREIAKVEPKAEKKAEKKEEEKNNQPDFEKMSGKEIQNYYKALKGKK